MVINGDVSPLWDKEFPRDQIPNIIQLVLDSWKTFKVGSERLEMPITRRFCAHLRNNKKRQNVAQKPLNVGTLKVTE